MSLSWLTVISLYSLSEVTLLMHMQCYIWSKSRGALHAIWSVVTWCIKHSCLQWLDEDNRKCTLEIKLKEIILAFWEIRTAWNQILQYFCEVSVRHPDTNGGARVIVQKYHVTKYFFTLCINSSKYDGFSR